MVKGPDIFDRIKYYRLAPMTLTGASLLLGHDYLAEGFLYLMQVEPNNPIYKPGYVLFLGAMGAAYVCFSFATIRNKRYYALTGRSFTTDHRTTLKPYTTLVSFYRKNDPYKMDIDSLPIISWKQAEGIILGKVKDRYGLTRLIRRASSADGSLASLGLPGCGKTTKQAAPSAMRFNAHLEGGGCGVFAISIKGDLLNFVRGGKASKRKKIKVFTPDNAEGSFHYNPLLNVKEMSWTERRVFAETLAVTVCPEERGENSAFFVGGARDYFSSILLYLLHMHDTGELEGKLRFHEIVDTILTGNVFELTTTIRDCGNTIPGEYTNGYIGSNERNISGIWSHLCNCVRGFNSGALRTLFDGEGDCIHPADLDSSDVYIDVPQQKYSIYAGAMRIIVSQFLAYEMSKPDISAGKELIPHLYLLDEAVQLHLDFNTTLGPALMLLRSRKCSLFLLFQSIASLETCYGEAHAREIIDLCAYISVFSAQDPKSRKFFQELIGKRKMLKRSTSLTNPEGTPYNTSGVTVNEVDEYIFQEADFGDLSKIDPKKKEKIPQVLVYANGKYILAETTPCYDDKKKKNKGILGIFGT